MNNKSKRTRLDTASYEAMRLLAITRAYHALTLELSETSDDLCTVDSHQVDVIQHPVISVRYELVKLLKSMGVEQFQVDGVPYDISK